MKCTRCVLTLLLVSVLPAFIPSEGDAANSGQNTTSSTPATPIYRVPADYAYFTAEKKLMPPYPPDALDKGLGGEVILDAEYSTDGKVADVQRIIGDPILAQAGIEAVSNWKFLPIVYKGQKARGLTYIGFRFQLADRSVTSLFPFGKWQEPSPDLAAPGPNVMPKRVRVSSGVVAGNKIAGTDPKYPDSAKSNRVEGEVDLRALIDKQGSISLLEIVKAPSQDLAISAIEAVKTWRYKPYLLNGEPVAVETTLVVRYTLRG